MTKLLRAACTRALATLLVLLAAVGLTAPAAHADTGNTQRVQIIWNVHSLMTGDAVTAQQDYATMIDSLRSAAGHNVLWDRLGDTETRTDNDHHVVEIRVMDNNDSVAGLYLRSDNLYLMGFWTGSPNSGSVTGLLGFSDQFQELQFILQRNGTPAAVQNIGYSSSYNALGSDRRTRVSMDMTRIALALNMVRRANTTNVPYNTTAFRDQLLILIQATAEAARFQDIRDRVWANIGLGRDSTVPNPHLDNDMIGLENNWGRISTWVHQQVNGTDTTTPSPSTARGSRTGTCCSSPPSAGASATSWRRGRPADPGRAVRRHTPSRTTGRDLTASTHAAPC